MRMDENDMTLCMDWKGEDVTGWYYTEKYDGCRAYWDGSQFWTRYGNAIKAPEWFTKDLPKMHLDGEIYAGKTGFDLARVAVQFGKFTEDIRFVVFDAPEAYGDYSERMEVASDAVSGFEYAYTVEVKVVESMKKLKGSLQRLKGNLGEGFVLRNPAMIGYAKGRSEYCLRVKSTKYFKRLGI